MSDSGQRPTSCDKHRQSQVDDNCPASRPRGNHSVLRSTIYVVYWVRGNPARDSTACVRVLLSLSLLQTLMGSHSLWEAAFSLRATSSLRICTCWEGASSGYAKIIGQNAKHDIVGTVALDLQRDLALLKISDVAAPSAASRR